jgi:hypothetical protein
MSILQDFTPVAIPSQKYHKKYRSDSQPSLRYVYLNCKLTWILFINNYLFIYWKKYCNFDLQHSLEKIIVQFSLILFTMATVSLWAYPNASYYRKYNVTPLTREFADAVHLLSPLCFYTPCLSSHPQIWISGGVSVGDLGGQFCWPPRTIHRQRIVHSHTAWGFLWNAGVILQAGSTSVIMSAEEPSLRGSAVHFAQL